MSVATMNRIRYDPLHRGTPRFSVDTAVPLLASTSRPSLTSSTMQLTSLGFTFLLSLASGLPLEGAQDRRLKPRSKTYAVVNVDGGSSTAAQLGTTTITDDRTKTVQVTDAASIITTKDVVTTTVVPAATPISSSESSSRSASSRTFASTAPFSTQISIIPTTAPTSSTTPKSLATTQSEQNPGTSLVTVTITEGPAPTEWYDNGLWHTRYPIKTRWE